MSRPLEQLPNTYRAFFGSFPSLTTAQTQLISPLLQRRDVVLQESTGAGKTEAVLAPVTENLITDPSNPTIIYIVPTKALALDMNRRIKQIYNSLGLKAGIRTGDGKSLCNGKPDLLIMTPESLDVLLGSRNPNNLHFIKHIGVLIIDEIHVMLNSDRGQQLFHLRRRLEMRSGQDLQTIALSATLADPREIAKQLGLKENLFVYKQTNPHALQPTWIHFKDQSKELPLFMDDLYRVWKCKKVILFANTRKMCEEIHKDLRNSQVFSQTLWLHYSSLSTRERREVEAAFRKSRKGICIATTTLELGIDIGDVGGVILMQPPPSVMAFLQRIGRGNRKQAKKKFWGICQGIKPQTELIQFLALNELAEANDVETYYPSVSQSVLWQQILSCVYAKKWVTTRSLQELFFYQSGSVKQIVEHMLQEQWLLPAAELSLYEGGWKYFSSLKKREIWSNFPPSSEEYDVVLEENKIASIHSCNVKQLEVGDRIRLSGRTLEILHFREMKTKKEVWVKQTHLKPTNELIWLGSISPTSYEVAQKMKAILFSDSDHPGLMNRTRQILDLARADRESFQELPGGIYQHHLENGNYCYKTFLGTMGNFILYHAVKLQAEEKDTRRTVSFDELGIESNERLHFGSLELPCTYEQLEGWVGAYLSILKASFTWNQWLFCLPKELQKKEIVSRFYDPRVLEHFERLRVDERLGNEVPDSRKPEEFFLPIS